MYNQLKFDNNGVVVKTGLSESEIIQFTTKILSIYNMEDSMCNRVTAKRILDSLVILERHLYALAKAGLWRHYIPTLREDFNELFAFMFHSKRSN